MSKDRGDRILVVDDDRELVEVYQHLFEAAGYVVATALSGTAALAIACAARPDVVLTDISMPQMDGFELMRRLRDHFGGQTPPVVVCSAFQGTERQAIAQGAQVFLRKPTSAEALIRSVKAARRGVAPDDQLIASQRAAAARERVRYRQGSTGRLRDVDWPSVAREAQPWLEWLRCYLDCGSAGIFLVQNGAVLPVVSVGPHLAQRPRPRLLQATLAAGVETGTSLVVADMAAHPGFRSALGQRPDIASFAGVPLVTIDGIRVGALCIADRRPDQFDADTLVLLEYLGRRGVSGLVDGPAASMVSPHLPAPLLARHTFEALLAMELKSARGSEEAVELTIGTLADGTSAGTCAEQVWRAGARARLAIGAMGAGRVGIFARGATTAVHGHVAACLDSVRSQGLMTSAGVAGVMIPTALSRRCAVSIAESALSLAQAGPDGPHVERIIVQMEPARQQQLAAR
jgi:CheY-like chemotaxis protein